MNIGKARALFEQVASGEYHGSTVGEYLEAVKIVFDMETHNSISKKMIISVCKWLVAIAEKAVSPYRWIPVSERLPETEEFVLASLTGKYRNTTFEHACEIADYADGEWCVYAYPHMSAEKCEELIEAWMPLPKPFEGGTE